MVICPYTVIERERDSSLTYSKGEQAKRQVSDVLARRMKGKADIWQPTHTMLRLLYPYRPPLNPASKNVDIF